MTEQKMNNEIETDLTSLDGSLDNVTLSEDVDTQAREPRPMTQADDLRSAVVSKVLHHLSEADGGLPLKTVEETSGRSVLLEFADDSRLLVQFAAIPSTADLDFELHDDEE